MYIEKGVARGLWTAATAADGHERAGVDQFFKGARARTPVLSLALAVCVRGCGIEPYCTRSDDKFFVLLVGARLIGLYTRMVGSCF